MKRTPFNSGWSFSYGLAQHQGPLTAGPADSAPVTLPHDFIISTDVRPDAVSAQDSGYYAGNSGVYTKRFTLDDVSGVTMLDFDGVYRNAMVKVNGGAVMLHHYGYTPFLADISAYLVPGENTVEVTADTLPEPNSRWYTGGGIYREVSLLRSAERYIHPRGICIRPVCTGFDTADIGITVTLCGEPLENETLRLSVLDDNGAAVCSAVLPVSGDEAGATVKMDNVRRWDVDSPSLYTLRAELYSGETPVDSDSSVFGVREVTIDAENGLRLNGRHLLLRGGNVHHDNGPLGAASFYISEYRRVKRMKENGYNALRCAHNPPSRALLRACDELGMLVVDEAFDMWLGEKKAYDYHMDFSKCWEEDMTAMVMRDRNHPCVFLWSIGNEITDMFQQGGVSRLRTLAAKLRELDPTRHITLSGIAMNPMTDADRREAIAWLESYNNMDSEALLDLKDPSRLPPFFFSITKETIDALAETVDMIDIHYEYTRYESMLRERPDCVILGSENKGGDLDMIWELAQRHSQIIGDFVWTAWDYIGEAGCGSCRYLTQDEADELSRVPNLFSFTKYPIVYPYRLSSDGDFDICGVLRPLNLYRRVVWGSDDTMLLTLPPELNGRIVDQSSFGWPDVREYWTYPGYEGQEVQVSVYSRADEVELLLNGVSMGIKKAGRRERFRTYFTVPYAPGTLTAISRTGGIEVSRRSIETIGAPDHIELAPETDGIPAGDQSIVYVDIAVTDAQGRCIRTINAPAKAAVTGEGELLAFASGRASTEENYTSGSFTSLNGRLLAVVRSTGIPGTAVLRVEVEGFPAAETELHFC